MLPLTLVQQGETVVVVQVGGNDAAKQHLADLGFVTGSEVNVVSSHNGDLIVNMKGTKLAMTREMAQKIKVTHKL
ncbi:MAG: FeoA family protein [Lachnospiraceae bacterium]|nr:FeoA family protein [Lachnospiraceae bacterium]